MLSEAAYHRWHQVAAPAAAQAVARGVPADDIPDECATALPDGRLEIWVEVPTVGRVSLVLGPEDWAWRTRPN
jgi:hypothetical protein